MAWCGTATSQVSNDQSQGGNVTASQQLDVVTNTSDTTAATTANGNSFTAVGPFNVSSRQAVSRNVAAQSVLNIAADARATTQSATAATGNAGVSAAQGGGAFSGSFLQTSGAATVSAESQINAADAQTGDASFSVQATANTQQLVSTGGGAGAAVSQSSSSTVTADGGVVFGDVQGQGSFAASGAGNSFTHAGQGSSGALDLTEVNTGAVTQGAVFANFGQSGVTATSATATGDSASIANTDGSLAVSANQNNQSFVHAEAVETSYAYGAAMVDAEGVGNSVLAANVGPGLALDNVQLNGAQGVESSASFQGASGYDASVSASAAGNTVTGFACSSCGGVMDVTNSQTNLGDAAASAQIGVTGAARSVRGVATAVGNSATFVTAN